MGTLRGFLRRILFDDRCPLCRNILSYYSDAICSSCLSKISGSSLKRRGDAYYLWRSEFGPLKWESSRAMVQQALAPIVEKHIAFICKKERISSVIFLNLEGKYFNCPNLVSKEGRELLVTNYIDRDELKIKENKIYFTLFYNFKGR